LIIIIGAGGKMNLNNSYKNLVLQKTRKLGFLEYHSDPLNKIYLPWFKECYREGKPFISIRYDENKKRSRNAYFEFEMMRSKGLSDKQLSKVCNFIKYSGVSCFGWGNRSIAIPKIKAVSAVPLAILILSYLEI
jgi:hypothetical protein